MPDPTTTITTSTHLVGWSSTKKPGVRGDPGSPTHCASPAVHGTAQQHQPFASRMARHGMWAPAAAAANLADARAAPRVQGVSAPPVAGGAFAQPPLHTSAPGPGVPMHVGQQPSRFAAGAPPLAFCMGGGASADAWLSCSSALSGPRCARSGVSEGGGSAPPRARCASDSRANHRCGLHQRSVVLSQARCAWLS